ncbi:unnamed protein product [Didymodactylos carnosus]|uniref:PLAC8 family protein n=1 Tax=Didymodactylos carnosus TaxID=1234261 RepID=A0A814VI75_9BILA|nr:unnamed protein product [Didymodactylos carnosus]CAF1316007.1 unnamed protein product [Didymodactylos carnosus]CAF3953596.1 unnamed protein product [Didymodactylos carnosus]CAF4125011.1 unnamed protein product [Didymodactylos carnosus]
MMYSANPQEEWRESMCGCCSDCRICCYGCWCTECLYGENAEKIDGSDCAGQCAIYWLLNYLGSMVLFPFGFIVHMKKRRQLRETYNLTESCGNDCLATCCCPSCSICQEARELKSRAADASRYVTNSQPMMIQPMPVMQEKPFSYGNDITRI